MSGKLLAIDVYHWDMISVLPVICAINLDVDLFVVKGMVQLHLRIQNGLIHWNAQAALLLGEHLDKWFAPGDYATVTAPGGRSRRTLETYT